MELVVPSYDVVENDVPGIDATGSSLSSSSSTLSPALRLSFLTGSARNDYQRRGLKVKD